MLGTVLKEAAKIGVSTIAKKGLDHLTSNNEAMLGLEEEMRLSHLQVLKAEKACQRDSFEIQREFKKISADNLSLNKEVQSDIKQVEKITADNYKLIRDQLIAIEKNAYNKIQIKEVKEILRSTSIAAARLAYIGEKTSNHELNTIGKIANQGIAVYEAFFTGSLIGGPAGGLLMGGIALAGELLKGKSKPDPGMIMIAEQFLAVHKKLETMDHKLDHLQESIDVVVGNQTIIVQNQQIALDAIASLFNFVIKMNKENQDYYLASTAQSQLLQDTIDEFSKILGEGQQYLALMDSKKLCAELNARLDGSIEQSTTKEYQTIAFGLSHAIESLTHPMLNNARWIEEKKFNETAITTNRLLKHVNAKTVAANYGYISHWLKSLKVNLKFRHDLFAKDVPLTLNPCEKKTVTDQKLQGKLDNELFEAAYSGDLKAVMRCVKEGANLEATAGNSPRNHHTALTGACLGGHLSIVKFLLEQGANINAMTGTHTLLYITAYFSGETKEKNPACRGNNNAVIKFLIEHYPQTMRQQLLANPDILNVIISCGYVTEASKEALRILIDFGANNLDLIQDAELKEYALNYQQQLNQSLLKVSNPILVAHFSKAYLKLWWHKKECLLNSKNQLSTVIDVINNILRFKTCVQTSPDLWNKLFDLYKAKLNEIAQWSQEIIALEMKPIDINKSVEELLIHYTEISDQVNLEGFELYPVISEDSNGNQILTWNPTPNKITKEHIKNEALSRALSGGSSKIMLNATLQTIDAKATLKIFHRDSFQQMNNAETELLVSVKDLAEYKAPNANLYVEPIKFKTGGTYHPNQTIINSFFIAENEEKYNRFLRTLDNLAHHEFLKHRKNAINKILNDAAYAPKRKQLFSALDEIHRIIKAFISIAGLNSTSQSELWDSKAIEKHYLQYKEHAEYQTLLPYKTLMPQLETIRGTILTAIHSEDAKNFTPEVFSQYEKGPSLNHV